MLSVLTECEYITSLIFIGLLSVTKMMLHWYPSSWKDENPFDIGKYLGIIDWENVPVDTKVLVSDDGKNWGRRYFKCYNKLIRKNNEEYPYVCFLSGCTSWSIGEECNETSWKYCKLAEDE